jgi:diguanylate cyclase (GGDEF)-like protein
MSFDAPLIGHGLRAILIEDEPATRRLLGNFLTQLGFQTDVLGSVADARARFVQRDFDLVIIDQELPDGSGLDLCQELEADGVDCKVVMISGHANLAATVTAIRHHVADYLIKPFDIYELRARLSRVVELLRTERSKRLMLDDLTSKNAELEALAVRDPLTGLFNHGYLQDALQREIARSTRHGHSFAFALLDVDRFNIVNETLGHTAGDRILCDVASLIATRSRRSDTPFRLAVQEVAARFAADVFALILPETGGGAAATKLETVRRAVRALELDVGGPVPATLSVGFANFPRDAKDRDGLIGAAQRALSAAKRVGGDQFVCYSPALAQSADDGAAVAAAKAAALGRSLSDNAFRFDYQPIIDVRRSELLGYEALCRPTDPAFAHVGDLLETAVRTGRIGELGRVLRKLVIAPMAQLPEHLTMFINIHPQDLNEEGLLELEPELAPWARRIVLEVTETAAIVDPARARAQIARLRASGLRIALDDLGSGYSSLNLLAQLEPDYVKLDMQLVRGIERTGRAARLIHHLLEFCRGEGLFTIAEGIETDAELQVVTELGVDYVQGFLLGRPSPPFIAGGVENAAPPRGAGAMPPKA